MLQLHKTKLIYPTKTHPELGTAQPPLVLMNYEQAGAEMCQAQIHLG